MDDSVTCSNVSRDDGCSVNHDAIADGKGKWVSVNSWSGHTVGDVCCRNFSIQHVIEENIREGCLSFRRIQVSEDDTCIDEGLICWSKDRERSITLEGRQKASLDNARNKRIVDACALGSAGDISWSLGWRQNFVDDVNHTVTGVNICKGNGSIVHHDAIPDGEGNRVTIDRWCRETLCYSRGGDFSRDDVVKEDISQCCFAFYRIKSGKVNACISKGLVCWRKEGKRTCSLKRFKQICLNDCCNQGIMDSSALSGSGDVIRSVRRREDLVDDMDDSVAGVHVGKRYICSVHHDSPVDCERERLAIHGGCRHAFCHC